MKKILLATIGLVAMAATANAADLGRMPVKAPPIAAPVWSWTGFYMGGNVGYSWGRSNTSATFTDNNTGVVLATANNSFNLNGVIGGGQFGYNWQAGLWVLGFEADFQGSGQKGSASYLCAAAVCGPAAGFDVTANLNQRLDWFGTVRGRLGWAIAPTILLYGTGGLAYGEIKTDGTISGFSAQGVATSTAFSTTTTRAGWTVGGGVEGQLVGNWTAKLEYLYMDLGTVSAGPVVTAIAPVVRADFLAGSFSSRVTDNILRVGVNYKF